MKPTNDSPAPRLVGTVADNETLLLSELARRFGWQRHATRQAKRKGLPCIRFGSKDYVRGCEFAEWLGSLQEGPAQ